MVVNSEDEEIKNVQTIITNNIKAKNVVDEDCPSVAAPAITLANPNDVILSDDEVKKIMGFKPEKTGEPKTKTSSLMKIYDYLMDEKVQQVLKVNHSKIEILKAIMDYQDGLMNKDTLCDYFIDED